MSWRNPLVTVRIPLTHRMLRPHIRATQWTLLPVVEKKDTRMAVSPKMNVPMTVQQ